MFVSIPCKYCMALIYLVMLSKAKEKAKHFQVQSSISK